MTAGTDQARLDEFMHRLIGFMTGSAVCYGIWLGDELGLYRVLADASSAVCAPNALSQEPGTALGAQDGEARLRQVFEQAGYTRFRRTAETPINMILQASP
jgi:hypothetical protein